MMKLDIYSDPICPWCYIGKAYLDRALENLNDKPFSMEWHPYQLNPNIPLPGINRQKYLEEKFGGKKAFLKAYGPIYEHAKKLGIKLAIAKIQKTPNTLNAHRLIHWAGLKGCQTSLVTALFEAYFLEGKDLGDAYTLSEIASRFSMGNDTIRHRFKTDLDLNEIQKRDKTAKIMGIQSVPVFIVANTHVVIGAQPTAFWEKFIFEIRRIEPEAGLQNVRPIPGHLSNTS